jgi:hypothetical protein
VYESPKGASADFTYIVDDTGYHWQAEIGDIGMPKTFDSGRRFTAVYKLDAPDHPDDPGPNRQAFYDNLLKHLQLDYASQPESHPVQFVIKEFEDGTFEVTTAQAAAAPVAIVPALPPAEEPAAVDPTPVNEPIGSRPLPQGNAAPKIASSVAMSILTTQDDDELFR